MSKKWCIVHGKNRHDIAVGSTYQYEMNVYLHKTVALYDCNVRQYNYWLFKYNIRVVSSVNVNIFVVNELVLIVENGCLPIIY